MIDWDSIESKYSFKKLDNGEYTTKVIEINVSDTPSQKGSYAVNFKLEPVNNVDFPLFSSHWISFGNAGWRQHHMKTLLTDMGVSEEKARAKIEECEKAGENIQIVDAYRKMFKAFMATKPQAKVVVETQPYAYTDQGNGLRYINPQGKRTEFQGDSYMSPQTLESVKERNPDAIVKGKENEEKPINSVEDLGGEEVKLDEIPF